MTASDGEPTVTPAAPLSEVLAKQHGVTAEGAVRIDRWLWAARMFKTRSAAAKACGAGHIKMDGDSVKASKTVRVGDEVIAVTPGGRRVLVVRRLMQKRGPAEVARALYDDHTPPPPPREVSAFVPRRDRGAGRPEKRDRRLLIRLRGR